MPETFKNPIFLDKVNKENLFNEIKKLIDNPNLRKKLQNYSGLNQEIINFIINNSGLDRKTLSNEIDFISSRKKFEDI